MAVKLTSPWKGRPEGAVLTLDDYSEVALVRAGAAVKVAPVQKAEAVATEHALNRREHAPAPEAGEIVTRPHFPKDEPPRRGRPRKAR